MGGLERKVENMICIQTYTCTPLMCDTIETYGTQTLPCLRPREIDSYRHVRRDVDGRIMYCRGWQNKRRCNIMYGMRNNVIFPTDVRAEQYLGHFGPVLKRYRCRLLWGFLTVVIRTITRFCRRFLFDDIYF